MSGFSSQNASGADGHGNPYRSGLPSQPSAPYASQGDRSGYDGSGPYVNVPSNAPIVIQVPEQRQSKAPWIVLSVVLGFLIILLTVSMASCSSVLGGLAGNSAPITTGKTVAVIHIDSEIASSGSSYVTPEILDSELSAAEDDKNVKSIVLRINSPGGTAAAGEDMAARVRDCTKPVVVSVGDYAASGAYMIASQADYIIATPGSTVGSIGCIMTVTNYEGLLNKLGITVENIKSGSEKDAGSPYRQLTDAERAKLQAEVNQINNQFIDLVASGRSLDRASVAAMADGSTWTGAEAVSLHLIDATGTYNDACKKAAELGNISGSYKMVDFDENTSTASTSLLDLLGMSSQSGVSADGNVSGVVAAQ